MGAKAPKFSSDDRVHSFIRAKGSTSTLFCPAQGFPVPSFRYRYIGIVVFHDFCSYSFAEPVGSKAPAFQSEAKSVTYVKHAKSSVALTCSAQASPPPNYR